MAGGYLLHSIIVKLPFDANLFYRETPVELLPPHAVVGLTGAFGSGCTTAAKYLRDERGFTVVRLSEPLRTEWKKKHTAEATRSDLQRLGDELRESKHGGILVELALGALKTEKGKFPNNVVIDGIRNVGEIHYLRDAFGYRFTVIAILASADARWDRIGASAYTDHGFGRTDFIADDQRDKNEETPYGQQVELCIDRADILIDNSVDVSTSKFKHKILDFVDLATGMQTRGATESEILMNIAFSSSHSSKCVKRHVGAVVADSRGQVVSAGYNENPIGTHPCVEEPEYEFRCFRDRIRNSHFERLATVGARCPTCGEVLGTVIGPPWVCANCREKKHLKTNLESFFFPDRAMNWCTAVHAEVWAILAAEGRARNAVLYTTTFPCSQCAEKIIQAGIMKVVFTEAYPDTVGASRLELAGIELEQFEGVRSASFERIFSRTKPD